MSDSCDDYVLETHDLVKEFEGFIAVAGVSLRIRRGDIHALIGPNGAGKTTLFNLLTNTVTPTRGRVFFNRRDITDIHPADVARAGLVRSFQISATFPSFTALENVRLALQRVTGSTFCFWRSDSDLEALNDRAMELLAQVGLEHLANLRCSELPYGQRRALELATTLALDPDVLLLDEPTAGLGSEDVQRITALIKKMSRGKSVLLVEHNLSVVQDLSDMITVMQRGCILAEGPYHVVSTNSEVLEAYIGSTDE